MQPLQLRIPPPERVRPASPAEGQETIPPPLQAFDQGAIHRGAWTCQWWLRVLKTSAQTNSGPAALPFRVVFAGAERGAGKGFKLFPKGGESPSRINNISAFNPPRQMS